MDFENTITRYLSEAWKEAILDKELQFEQGANLQETLIGDIKVYQSGVHKMILFSFDNMPEKGESMLWNAIREIKKIYPECSRYNFKLEDSDQCNSKVTLILA